MKRYIPKNTNSCKRCRYLKDNYCEYTGKEIKDNKKVCGIRVVVHDIATKEEIAELEKYKKCWEELQNLHLKTKGELAKETINETDVIVYTQMMILEQKYNLGSDKDVKD